MGGVRVFHFGTSSLKVGSPSSGFKSPEGSQPASHGPGACYDGQVDLVDLAELVDTLE